MRQLEIYVNSYLDRLTTQLESSSLEFTVLLEGSKKIRIYPDEKKVSLKLASIELPNVLYNFSFYTSYVWFIWDIDGPNEGLHNIKINTERVYTTPNDIIDELNSLIISHPALNNIEFNYIDNEKKITISNNSSVKIKLISSFRYQEEYNGEFTFNDMMDRLGFTQNLKNVIINPSNTLKARGMVKMLRSNCFFLECTNIAGSFNQNIIPNPSVNKPILARLSTSDFGTLSQLSYPAIVDFNIRSETSIEQFTFRLLDEEFQPVDLGQFPITFSLIMTIQ